MLSILIPSITERADILKRLRMELRNQINHVTHTHPSLGKVETWVNSSLSFLNGGASIGVKRQNLLNYANGKYVCFLDDDESIAPNYVETLLRLCNQDSDVCTFRALAKLQNSWGLIDMRLSYKVNDQFTPDHDVRRPPWHICPVRTEFAKLYQFKDINNAEDFEWFEHVLAHCTTEAHTDKIIFQYNHGPHSEADKIENHVFTK